MASLIEIAYHTAATLKESYGSKNPPPIPRTSFPVAIGIETLFPDTSTNRAEVIRIIHKITPPLIALNEAADIGVSAELQFPQADQSKYYQLLHLRNLTFHNLQARLELFLSEYQPKSRKPNLQPMINDVFWLSRHRREFPIEQWPQYLEFDSGIFEALYMEASVPEVLITIGFDPTRSVTSITEMQDKYRVFITDSYRPNELVHNFERSIRALHGLEMLLKVGDDEAGEETDALLGLPNYARWSRHMASVSGKNPADILRQVKSNYREIAVTNGLPRIVVPTASWLSRVTSAAKAYLAKKEFGTPLSPSGLDNLFEGPQQTTLRHQLDGCGSPLVELFSQPL